MVPGILQSIPCSTALLTERNNGVRPHAAKLERDALCWGCAWGFKRFVFHQKKDLDRINVARPETVTISHAYPPPNKRAGAQLEERSFLVLDPAHLFGQCSLIGNVHAGAPQPIVAHMVAYRNSLLWHGMMYFLS